MAVHWRRQHQSDCEVKLNARGKTVDKTFLSLDNAEKRGFIHRDYIAHCFRWTHACKMIQARWRDAVILDVGCGKEMPFPKMIYSSKMRPKHYIGLDVGDWPVPDMLSKVTFPLDKLVGDIADVETHEDLGLSDQPNFITCFEVLEHVEWEHAARALTAMRKIAAPDVIFMVSTPCWNGKDTADNHVNEMTYTAFGALLEHCGWTIKDHFGTFASQSDLKAVMTANETETFEALRRFYDSNVLSCIFAPIYPSASRNCIWDCINEIPSATTKRFPDLKNVPKPWGSSQA